MHPPCELMVDEFLPSMRALVARKLSEDKLSQGKIAAMLGLTQASVSSYLSGSGSRPLATLSRLGVSKEEAGTYAALLAEDLKANPTYAVGTLYSIWDKLIGSGAACASHRQQHPILATCDVCIKVFGPERRGSGKAVDAVSDAMKTIEGSSLFVRVMPEVSVNLAFAPDGARSPSDVVAIPGRIVRVMGRARSFLRPEFGASAHLAAVLLEVQRVRPDLRAAINLRYDQRMARVLTGLNVVPLTIGHSYPAGAEDKVVGALRARLSQAPSAFDAVVDLGGEGLEPSLYLFAEDPSSAVRKSMEIARAYASTS